MHSLLTIIIRSMPGISVIFPQYRVDLNWILIECFVFTVQYKKLRVGRELTSDIL